MPLPTTGLVLDLDASLLAYSDGATVTAWADQSGNGNNASSQSGTPVCKTNILNGNRIVRFDGASSLVCANNSNFNLTSGFTMLVVAKQVGGHVCGKCDISLGVGAAGRRKLLLGHYNFFSGADTNRFDYYGHGCGPQKFAIYSIRVTAANAATQYVNGTAQAITSVSLDIATTNTVSFQVGRPFSGNGAEGLIGDIAELVIYNNTASQTDHDNAVTYLLSKWGITAGLPMGWNPADYASDPSKLALWVDMNESTDGTLSNGSAINAIYDISAELSTFAGAGTAKGTFNTGALNSRPCATIDGVDDWIPYGGTESQFDMLTAWTTIVVWYNDSASNGPLIAKGFQGGGAADPNRRLFSHNRNGLYNGPDANGSATYGAAGTSAQNAWNVQGVKVISVSSVKSRVGDASALGALTAATVNANFNVTGNNSQQLGFGRSFGDLAVEFAKGKIAAFIIFREAISDANLQTVMERLGYTYGFTWGVAPAGNKPVFCANTINFFQTLTTQGFVIRPVVATTVTRVQGGGRHIVKTAAGVLWHVYYEGGSLKAAYSSDNGTTWTVTSVGPTWVPAGMSLCIGAGDVPALALARPSNDDFYFYLWNGTTWVLKKQLNTPVAESGSFQLLYTGSTYMLVFAYITSTSDRRVYSKTSTDLVTWATSVLIKNGDGSGTGPHVYRRLAACLDASANVHAVYSIRSGGSHKLYYRKYSGGVWGTEELIATGSSGNNITDFHSGLSIAVDDRGYVHVAARIRGTTYTGNVKVVYFRRETTWTQANVHTEVDQDQDYPSISMNQRTPVICWASAGLGLNVTMAKRGSDATWSYSQITANARDSVQTVHGPSYGSTYNYTRGVVGSMRGSEEYFYSTDIISGNAAAMETTLNFTSILSTQRRVMANTITFTSALSAIRALGLYGTINFASRLNFSRTRAMSNNIDFTQHLDAGVNTQPISQTLHFTSILSGVKSPNIEIHQTINFTSRLNRTISGVMSTSIQFSGILGSNIVKRQTISQTINFVSRVTYNASLKKTMSNIINFFVGLVAMKADEGCQPTFTPERPLPASEDDVNFVYLIGPLPSPSLTVQLKRPEYGNQRRQALQVKVNRTRGGKLRVHSRAPTYEPQTIHFESLSYLKLEQVRNFLRVCKGKKCYYIDEKNRKWIGYFISTDVDLSEEARDRGGQFQLEFEGILAS